MSSSASSSAALHNFLLISPLLLLLLPVHVETTEAVKKLAPNVSFPAVFAFGDSILDTGNNNYLFTVAKGNYPPYGRDFKGGIPTGRFCNGKIPTDIIAEQLGVKEYVPAYLDPSLTPADLLTGVSFASGGAGYDPLTSELAGVMTIARELEYFKEYINKLKRIAGEERSKSIIRDAFYIVEGGGNDIANIYFDTPTRKLTMNISGFTDIMIQGASTLVQELHKLGARNIGVFNVPPLGCIPVKRTLSGGVHRACSEKYNQAARLFNRKLSSTIIKLNNNLPNANAMYMDIYGRILNIIGNSAKYGFEVVDKGCCGTGLIETTVLCNRWNPFTCADADKYFFWDSYHPTQRGYEEVVIPVIQQYLKSIS